MERDARGAVCQIVRYEKVQGPIITVMESEEPLYFWDAFSNFLPLMDKLKNEGDSVESSSKWPPFASCETEHETHLPVRESSWSMLRRKFVSGNMKDFVFSSKSDLTSSTPSNSSASVLPSKISPQSISKTSKYIDVNFASQTSSQLAPGLSKKFPLSQLQQMFFVKWFCQLRLTLRRTPNLQFLYAVLQAGSRFALSTTCSLVFNFFTLVSKRALDLLFFNLLTFNFFTLFLDFQLLHLVA
ncbi:hypothetical protein CQW23_13488 [Capsicum baccatum]|uniref:Uncharacterized protein n=1 Tax=Capsicum baccatum TaxID=33114 RepID=A0A2G2WVS8_CAPBA|nr:hypothetical protein CQW23_13488 [Capsicum baccatum]